MNRTCPCGSAEPSCVEYDARGIPLTRCCRACRAERLSKYRPEVLTNPQYECDEPIEEDYQ